MSKDQNSSASKSLALSFYTFLSRVLGLIRDHFMATSFGTGWIASAFSVAYRLPNMFRNLLAEGTLSQSFMPLYSESGKVSEEEAKIMSGAVLTFLFFLLSIFIGLFLVFAPYFIPLLVGGDAEYSNLIIELSAILFILIMTASLASIFMAISNSLNRFFVPSLSPIILNLAYLIVFIAIYPFIENSLTRIRVLCFGIVTGGVIQLIVQSVYLYKLNLAPKLNFNWRHSSIKKIFQLMLPATIGGGFYQIGLLVDIFLANYIQNNNPGLGAVVSLDYAQRLVQFPTGIIGVALATTTLPSLLTALKNEQKQIIPDELVSVISFCAYLTVPASIAFMFAGGAIIDSIFYGGKWDHKATENTVYPLLFYSIAIPAYSMNKILTSSYYAFKDTSYPLKINIISFGLNIGLNFFLMQYFLHAGLAFSSAICANLITILLIFGLKKHDVSISVSQLLKKLKYHLFPQIVMAIWIIVHQQFLYTQIIQSLNSTFSHANSSRLYLLYIAFTSIVLYFGISKLIRIDEFMIIYNKFFTRLINKLKR